MISVKRKRRAFMVEEEDEEAPEDDYNSYRLACLTNLLHTAVD